MTIIKSGVFWAFAGAILFIGVLFAMMAYGSTIAAGATSFMVPAKPSQYQNVPLISATTTSATTTQSSDGSGYAIVSNAKKVIFYFTHGGTATTSTGGAVFTVQSSPDGVTWNNYNKLIQGDVSSTASSSITVQGATTTAQASANLVNDTYYAFRVIINELPGGSGSQGEHTATLSEEF